MDNISKFAGPNLGGNRALQFLPVEAIATIPDPVNGAITGDIVLAGVSDFYSIYSTDGTLLFEETPKQDQAGEYYESSISAFIPKASVELLSILVNMQRSLYVVKVTDNNGLTRLAGNIANPLQMTFQVDPKDNVSSRNGIKITFAGRNPDPWPYINN